MSKFWIPPVCDNPIPLTKFLKDSNSEIDSITDSSVHKTFSKDGLYEITAAKALSPTHQKLPINSGSLHIYTLALPPVTILESLVGIKAGSFTDTCRDVGLLFPQPISKSDYVCRLPVYLSRGLARARVRKVNSVRIDQLQLRTLVSAHSVLAELLTEMIHYELWSVDDGSSAANFNLTFDQFDWNPENSIFGGLMTIVTGKSIDWDALQRLLSWSEAFHHWHSGIRPTYTIPASFSHGIVSNYPCALKDLPESVLPGLLIRAQSIPKADLGLFIVNGIANNPDAKSKGGTINCYRLSRHLNACRVTSGRCPSDKISDPKPVFYQIADCFVHPLSGWLWFTLSMIPTVLYQLNRALLNLELCATLLNELSSNNADSVEQITVLLPDRIDAPKVMLHHLHVSTTIDEWAESSNQHRTMDKKAARLSSRLHHIPAPLELLEATTLLGACDAVNLERLEFLGDSLLQLITTLKIFQNSPPDANEKQLTMKRSNLVSNANLCGIAVRQGWYRFCTSRPYDIENYFVPPGFTIKKQYLKPEDPRVYDKLTNKSLADMMEALLGCFLHYVGLREACELLRRFGIAFDFETSFSSDTSLCRQLGSLKLHSKPDDHEMDLFEGRLGYKFKDITLFDEARTHGSYMSTEPRVTYDRFEFLGDALLGYIISTYLFRKYSDYDPGELSIHRSRLVNNLVLACALVQNHLHTIIRSNIPALPSVIESIRSIHWDSVKSLEWLEQKMQSLTSETPVKTLGDVFEALLGAVFVDSGNDLNVVDTVIRRLLGKFLKLPLS